MNKLLKKKTNEKKVINPFLKHKDANLNLNKKELDLLDAEKTYNNLKDENQIHLKFKTISSITCGMSALLVPYTAILYYGNDPKTLSVGITTASLGFISIMYSEMAKETMKKINKEKKSIENFNEVQKNYLFGKMYQEFENVMKKGKDVFNGVVGAFIMATTIGVSYIMSQNDYVKKLTIGLTLGAFFYMGVKVSEYLGEKKAIKEIEKMM